MHSFTVCLTHDVDRVYKTYHYLTRDIRRGQWRRLRTLVNGESPFWRFEAIMELEEKFGARSTFFFLKETMPFRLSEPKRWKLALGRYSYDDTRVRAIIRDLDRGGWEIGVHGSYDSFRSRELLEMEKASLEEIVGHRVLGIRQHYLNLEIPATWQLQKQAGFVYDASFGRKPHIGFPDGRYSPFFDDHTGMFIIPLALMEAYLFPAARHSVDRAWEMSLALIEEAERNQAVLTVLWHPHEYNDEEYPGYATIYERIIRECHARGARFRTCIQLYNEYHSALKAD